MKIRAIVLAEVIAKGDYTTVSSFVESESIDIHVLPLRFWM